MITADQILCHAIGDYLLQSDWMAINKTKNGEAALIHAVAYALPFLALGPSLPALLVIVGTHALIDRYRLARYVVWVKNFIGPIHWTRLRLSDNPDWSECSVTGYPADRPAWLTVWLLIIADNILHVAINGAALRWL